MSNKQKKNTPTQTRPHCIDVVLSFLYNSNLCLVVFPGSGGCEHSTEGALPRERGAL